MMPSPIVIFDAGNVLIRYEPGEALRRLAHAARCSRWRVRLAFTLAGGGRLGTGGISPEEFAAAFGQRLGVHLTPMRVQQFWGLDLKGPVEGMFDLIERLRRRGQARIAILSDTNAFHWGHCLERWPELRRIPDQFVSYETGLRKPDPRVYRLVEERLRGGGDGKTQIAMDPFQNHPVAWTSRPRFSPKSSNGLVSAGNRQLDLPASPILFFDDTAANVRAAAAAGWNAHLFTGRDQAEKVLVEHGLL